MSKYRDPEESVKIDNKITKSLQKLYKITYLGWETLKIIVNRDKIFIGITDRFVCYEQEKGVRQWELEMCCMSGSKRTCRQ